MEYKCVVIRYIIHFFLKILFLSKKNDIFSSDDTECSICMEFDKTIIFYPCKHFHCCEFCSMQIKLCPICREIIQYKIKST